MSRKPIREKFVYVLMDKRKPGKFEYGDGEVYDYEPFYVGLGSRQRPLDHKKEAEQEKNDSHKTRKIKKILASGHKLRCRIIKKNLTHEEAQELEIALIALIGRSSRGGPLVNQTRGGDGLVDPSDETRAKMSRSAKRVHAQRTAEEYARIKAVAEQTRARRTPEQEAELFAILSAANKKVKAERTHAEYLSWLTKVQTTVLNRSEKERRALSRRLSEARQNRSAEAKELDSVRKKAAHAKKSAEEKEHTANLIREALLSRSSGEKAEAVRKSLITKAERGTNHSELSKRGIEKAKADGSWATWRAKINAAKAAWTPERRQEIAAKMLETRRVNKLLKAGWII